MVDGKPITPASGRNVGTMQPLRTKTEADPGRSKSGGPGLGISFLHCARCGGNLTACVAASRRRCCASLCLCWSSSEQLYCGFPSNYSSDATSIRRWYAGVCWGWPLRSCRPVVTYGVSGFGGFAYGFSQALSKKRQLTAGVPVLLVGCRGRVCPGDERSRRHVQQRRRRFCQ